ncbi:SMP-30/gluconolactonase/LRE family protein [bacterium]|nr:SMP-30/gluconolactonase/LRE family protein [bacterium]
MTCRSALCVLGIVLVTSAVSCEKKTTEKSPEVSQTPQTAVSSGLDAIVPAGAKLEKVTTGYEFDTAGSPLDMNGVLYFTNNNFDPADRSCTVRMDAAGQYTVLRKDNGVTTTLQNSGKGTIYACEMLGHRVVELDRDCAVLRVLCGEYNGKRIDGPNDLVVDRKGGIYFTDSQFIGTQQKMQDKPAVYYIRPDGTVIRIIDDVKFPNGLWLSPDEKTLYICNTQGRYLLAYDVNPDGTTANGRNFAELQLNPEVIGPNSEESGADGIAVDSAGNVYVATTKGFGIQVFDSAGKHLGNILCDTATNNLNFGGSDLKTLYVSAKDGIYKIPVKIPGMKAPQG